MKFERVVEFNSETVLTESGDQKEANQQEIESSNDKLRVPVSET